MDSISSALDMSMFFIKKKNIIRWLITWSFDKNEQGLVFLPTFLLAIKFCSIYIHE